MSQVGVVELMASGSRLVVGRATSVSTTQQQPSFRSEPSSGNRSSNQSGTGNPVQGGDGNGAGSKVQKEPSSRTNPPSAFSQNFGNTGGQTPSTRLRLTSNPFEAYNIQIPNRLVVSSEVEDPLSLVTNFNIVNAELQQPMEPAFRIAVIAEAAINQNVKVFDNACNIFVRMVLNLAGYPNGGHYLANDFGQLFEKLVHSLNHWRKASYKIHPNLSASRRTLKSDLDQYLDNYAFIAQVDRSHIRSKSGKVKPGHVGILVRSGGKLYLYDSQYLGRGPRKKQIGHVQLLNSDRANLNIYSLPEIKSN